MAIGELCNREVVIAQGDMGVPQAANLMRQYHVGTLVVVDSLEGPRRPLGIVTDRDIVVEVVAEGVPADTLTLADIMAPQLVTVRETEGVFETLRFMRQHGVRRVPVVDHEGWLQGIVTFDDLIELLAEEMGELARLVAQEQRREEATRK